MRPTLFGLKAILFYAVVLGAYFAAPYVNLFFLLLAFLTIQWCLAALWTWRNGSGVEVKFSDLSMAEAWLPSVARCTVRAPKRKRFNLDLVLSVQATQGGPKIAEGHIDLLQTEARARVEIPPLPRGVHPVASATLSTHYPFGLLRRRTKVDGPKEIVVYPKPSSLAQDGAGSVADWLREMTGDALAGGGELQPSSLRDRREGDSLRSVHWRASARRQKLVVQEWDGGGGEGLEIALDRRANAEELEGALSDIAALILIARPAKEILALRTQGLSETFGDGHSPWDQALRFLAEATPLPMNGPPPPSVSPTTPVLPRKVVHA